jgi:hypothetical protein
MKTVLQPALEEKAAYTCDLTGKPLDSGMPLCLTLQFGYGSSQHDGETFEFHLSSEAEEVLVPFLRACLLQGRPMTTHRTRAEFQESNDPAMTGHERAAALDNLQRFLEQCRSRTPDAE